MPETGHQLSGVLLDSIKENCDGRAVVARNVHRPAGIARPVTADQILDHLLAEGESLGVVGQLHATKPFGPGGVLMYGEVIMRHDSTQNTQNRIEPVAAR